MGKQLNKKAKNNSQIYDVTDWTSSYNTHIARDLSSTVNQIMKFGPLTEYITQEIFLLKNDT